MIAAAVKRLEAENSKLQARINLLSQENENLKRLNAIESIPRRPFGFSNTEGDIFKLLMAREIVSKRAMMDWLYEDNPDAPEPKVIDVYLCKMRRILREHDADIRTVYGTGCYITPEHKARLRQLMAAQS